MIGLAVSHLTTPTTTTGPATSTEDVALLVARLQTVQQYMFDLGAHLATPRPTSSANKISRTPFAGRGVDTLERWIDDMEPRLAPLTTFVLPGGHPAAAALHVARTVARRAERTVTPLVLPVPSGRDGPAVGDGDGDGGGVGKTEGEFADGGGGLLIDEAAYRFLNRLSDFLFVASRWANCITGCPDVTWQKQDSRDETEAAAQ